MPDLPLSHRIQVADVPPTGKHVRIEASEAERRALAEHLEIAGVDALVCEFEVRHWGRDGLVVHGRLEADVVQTCIVTLEPVPEHVSDDFEVRFTAHEAPETGRTGQGKDEEDEGMSVDIDAPDVLDNGGVDLGVIATEYLALGLDPYPRKEGAAFSDHVEEAQGENRPFAGLDKLVSKDKQGK
jgi:uncharacterized metal-binding protein YceD (DUF177 family)